MQFNQRKAKRKLGLSPLNPPSELLANERVIRIGLVGAMLLAAFLIIAGLAAGQSVAATSQQDRLAEAQHLQTAGNNDQARDLYEQILQADPSNPDAREGMSAATERVALGARAAGKMDDALADLLRAQKVEPNDTRVLYDLAILEDEMRLYKDADKVLDRLVPLLPGEPNVRYARARVKFDLGDLDAALIAMQAYLKVRPLDASAHYGLGRIYLLQLQFDKAHEEFQQSINIQPMQTEAYYQLGQTDLEQNDYHNAIELFHKTLERDPQHGGALTGIGIAFFKQKQFDDAAQWLTKATQAAPDYQPAHYYLGLTLARLNRADDSKRELQTAAALADKDNKQSASGLQLMGPNAQP
jgi:tetratricopeptide (TPR) repeat protein